jgi:hypothetical protein
MPRKVSMTFQNYDTPYLKRLHKHLQAVNDKASYVEYRHNILKSQKGKNYQMESDRINGILKQSALSQTHPNYHRLRHRAQELHKLGAKAFNRGIDE